MIGGGFIGSEIAAALALNGCPVTMVFPEPGIGARIFPAAAVGGAQRLLPRARRRGAGRRVGDRDRAHDGGRSRSGTAGRSRRTRSSPDSGSSRTSSSQPTPACRSRTASSSTRFGRVGGREDVFAAGDVARFPVAALGAELRVEHEDHAKSHGRQVGANMAGADEPYDHLPFFYSDLFDLGYEAVGELDSRLETLADVGRAGRQGDRSTTSTPSGVRAASCSGTSSASVDAARELIRAGEPIAEGATGAMESTNVH